MAAANVRSIRPTDRWVQNGVTVAGGNGLGGANNQLNYPVGLYVDNDETIYIADHTNHRIVKWRSGDTTGQVVAGGNGMGSGLNQLNHPTDVIVDKQTNNVIVCDRDNRRVVLWSLQAATTQGRIIIPNILCWGLAMDNERNLYVSDVENHAVRRYLFDGSMGTVVAGGNGQGNHRNQLDKPEFIFVDEQRSVYVSDYNNARVMKWMVNAAEGIQVAGNSTWGPNLTQLSRPTGLFVDSSEAVYVAEGHNNRVTRWRPGAHQGDLVLGNQLDHPNGLSYDTQGNLYVVEYFECQVKRFPIENN